MHKEEYYSQESIVPEGTRMAGDLPINPRAAAFQPAAAALLVIDMQDYFLRPESHAFLPAAPAIIPKIGALIQSWKRSQRPVLFTRHANRPADAGQMALWWRELLSQDHPLGGIDANLLSPGDRVVEKTQYDAFFNTDLESRLRKQGAEQLVVTGVTTHLCCESTARSAFARGFAVYVAIDGTATLNRELHVASLRGMAHGCAVPLRADDLLAAMAGRP